MKSKLVKFILLLAILGSITVGFITIVDYNAEKTKESIALNNSEKKIEVRALENPNRAEPVYNLPVKLKIPKINVDATIIQVGITPTGEVDVPKDPATVGWYNLNPRPGEKGNAIIDGHYGWTNNSPAVFDNLYKLEKGDKIYIEDEKGKIISFIVKRSEKFDPDVTATSVFISSDNKSHLNLITCEGVWNNVSKSYSKRLVIFTDKEYETDLEDNKLLTL